MKKHLLKLCLLALCLMGANSAWADTMTTMVGQLGASDNSGAFNDDQSKAVTIAAGESYVYTFINYNKGTSGTDLWENWTVEGVTEDTKYFDFRADGGYWGEAGTNAYTGSVSTDVSSTATEWLSAYNGVTVTLTISRSTDGGTITVEHTATLTDGSTTYAGKFTCSGLSGAINVYLKKEDCHLIINKVVYTNASSKVITYELKNYKTWTFTGNSTDENVTTDGNTTLTENKTSCALATAPTNCAGIYLNDSWKCYKNTNGLRNASNGNRLLVVPDLQANDLVTITCNNTDYIVASKYTGTANSDKKSIVYPMNAAGNFYISLIKNGGTVNSTKVYPALYTINVAREEIEGYCEDPSYTITGASGNSRIFTLACTTLNSEIYYSETELSDADGGTKYTGAVTTSASKIWAYGKNGTATSDVISFETGAGSTLTLIAPTITRTGENTVTITSDQSSILGAPTGTINYTCGGSSDVQTVEGKTATLTDIADGTITAYITATGYSQSESATLSYKDPSKVGTLVETLNTGKTFGAYNASCTSSEIEDKQTDGTSFTNETYTCDENTVTKLYFQKTDGGDYAVYSDHIWFNNFNVRSNNTWYTNSASSSTRCHIVFREMTKGSIILINSGDGPISSKNVTVASSDYLYGNYNYAYTVSEDGDVMLVYARIGSGPTASNNTFGGFAYYVAPKSATVTSAGYATFSSTWNLDLGNITSGYTANAATKSSNSNYVHLEPVTSVVPANTGLIFSGSEGTCSIPVAATATATTAPTENYLVAVTEDDTEIATGNYVLGKDATGVGFFLVNSELPKLNAGKAYLSSTINSEAKALYFSFVDDATAISNVNTTATSQATSVYNLAGQRIQSNVKGISIVKMSDGSVKKIYNK